MNKRTFKSLIKKAQRIEVSSSVTPEQLEEILAGLVNDSTKEAEKLLTMDVWQLNNIISKAIRDNNDTAENIAMAGTAEDGNNDASPVNDGQQSAADSEEENVTVEVDMTEEKENTNEEEVTPELGANDKELLESILKFTAGTIDTLRTMTHEACQSVMGKYTDEKWKYASTLKALRKSDDDSVSELFTPQHAGADSTKGDVEETLKKLVNKTTEAVNGFFNNINVTVNPVNTTEEEKEEPIVNPPVTATLSENNKMVEVVTSLSNKMQQHYQWMMDGLLHTDKYVAPATAMKALYKHTVQEFNKAVETAGINVAKQQVAATDDKPKPVFGVGSENNTKDKNTKAKHVSIPERKEAVNHTKDNTPAVVFASSSDGDKNFQWIQQDLLNKGATARRGEKKAAINFVSLPMAQSAVTELLYGTWLSRTVMDDVKTKEVKDVLDYLCNTKENPRPLLVEHYKQTGGRVTLRGYKIRPEIMAQAYGTVMYREVNVPKPRTYTLSKEGMVTCLNTNETRKATPAMLLAMAKNMDYCGVTRQ